MKTASIRKFTPTTHAIDRAQARFGIASDKVSEWVTDKMINAKYIASSGADNCSIYESDEIRFVINEVTNMVVTIHHAISTDFLAPVIERERRRLYREHTRQTRSVELAYANALRELSDMAINRARARNPKTRELISQRMTDKQAEISSFVGEIERLTGEYDARVRVMEMIKK